MAGPHMRRRNLPVFLRVLLFRFASLPIDRSCPATYPPVDSLSTPLALSRTFAPQGPMLAVPGPLCEAARPHVPRPVWHRRGDGRHRAPLRRARASHAGARHAARLLQVRLRRQRVSGDFDRPDHGDHRRGRHQERVLCEQKKKWRRSGKRRRRRQNPGREERWVSLKTTAKSHHC